MLFQQPVYFKKFVAGAARAAAVRFLRIETPF
jgi:hypothetical protein